MFRELVRKIIEWFKNLFRKKPKSDPPSPLKEMQIWQEM